MKEYRVGELLQALLNAAKKPLRDATGAETVLGLSVEFPNVTENDVLSCADLPYDIGLAFHGWNKGHIKLQVTQPAAGPTLAGEVRTDVTVVSDISPRIDIWPHYPNIQGVTAVKLMQEHKGHRSLYWTKHRGRWILCNKGGFASENDAYAAPELVGTVTVRQGSVFFRDDAHKSLWTLVREFNE